MQFVFGNKRKESFNDSNPLEDSDSEDFQKKDDDCIDNEEDPLDCFMKKIDTEIKKKKHKELDTNQQVYENEDDHDVMYNLLQEEKAREISQKKELTAEVEYDSDDNPIIVKREVLPLPPVDHEAKSYLPVKKEFYLEHESIANLTDEEVSKLRLAMSIRVSGNNLPKPVCSFGHCSFPEKLIKEIIKMEFSQLTPIQAQTIPAALMGRDIIGIAKTGSGKTCAFLWPMLIHIQDQPKLQPGEGPIGLICAPTRELAQQIHVETKRFSKCFGFQVVAIYGGDSKYEQTLSLKEGAEVVVATPGRLIDVARTGKNSFSFDRISFLILDEADRMFDLGFESQVKSIVNNTRPDRQSIFLYCATFKKKIEKLASKSLTDPVRIVIGDVGEANEDITQHVFLFNDSSLKWYWLLDRLVAFLSEGSVLIFVNKKENCVELSKNLSGVGHNAGCLQGDLTQNERNNILVDFKSKRISILIATDVAARGLDIPSIKTVVNFDAAKDLDTHTHRIGRTGRAGSKGSAYTLLSLKEHIAASYLVQSLKGANQIIKPELLELAKKNPKFRKTATQEKSKLGIGLRGTCEQNKLSSYSSSGIKANNVSRGLTKKSQLMEQFKSTFRAESSNSQTNINVNETFNEHSDSSNLKKKTRWGE